MKKVKDLEAWGRATARKRYAEGGEVKPPFISTRKEIMGGGGGGGGGGGWRSTPREVSGGGNTRYVQKPDGGWWKYDNFGPVGAMPKGWDPSQ